LNAKPKRRLRKEPLDCKNRATIDLHIHSTASDGSLSPEEILDLSKDLNLGAVSIVDHDTIEGSRAAISAGIPPGLKFLTGVEISANPPPHIPCSGSFHILGYRIRLDDPVLNRTLKTLQNARKNRNPQIIQRLNRLGLDITMKDVLSEFEDGQLGRPHIARCLVAKGYAESIDDAFDTYLGKGQPAYVDKYRMESFKAMEIILEAGGIPVLAHPFLIQLKGGHNLEQLIEALKSMGLRGLEVYYPEHPPEHTVYYAELANRHGLLMTGGTDFHGSLKPEIKMGSGRGELSVPYRLYEQILQSR
jgi:predicted metal-dependent phosphoesterase TrpH